MLVLQEVPPAGAAALRCRYPVRDPNTFAIITRIFICNECVARFAESLAQESPKAPGMT
jgi:hypothetical protein